MKGVDALTGRGVKFKERTGLRSGRLVFVEPVGVTRHGRIVWRAQCDCGQVVCTGSPEKVQSCGCLRREVAAKTQRAKALPPEVRLANRSESRKRARVKGRANPVTAMQARLSRLHRHALRAVGAIKSSPTFHMLGYTPDQLVRHMARQFVDGMGWHNVAEWQIDHIIPVSEAKSAADVVALNQLSNLRPMWAIENNSKRDRRLLLL